MDYLLHILILAAIYSILAMSLNLVVGYMGIVSVAHGALFGVGAYVYAILSTQYYFPPIVSILLCCTVTAILGYILGAPSLRLKGDYLALATFGFAIVGYDLFNNLISLTKGPMGISGISKPLVGFAGQYGYFALTIFFTACAWLLIRRLAISPWGRIIHAIRNRENVLPLCGKNPVNYKLITLAFASFWTGIAGALYAGYSTYIHPSNFVPMVSIIILCMVIIGGMGSLSGSILGALIFVSIPELLRFLNVPTSMAGTLNQLFFGLLLILLMLVRPQGFLGKYKITNQ
jgi:branched-chain amino acid transport system permease protein